MDVLGCIRPLRQQSRIAAMSETLAERLRHYAEDDAERAGLFSLAAALIEAAARIEELERENAALHDEWRQREEGQ
jgi:hypothetical protein